MTKHRNALQLGLVLVASSLLIMGTGGDASADFLSIHADARAGVGGGKGMFGARKDDAFHPGGVRSGYGFVLGGELLFLDGWVEHNQFITDGSVSGTWTQFMLGVDVNIDIGDQKSFSFDDAGKKVGGYSSMYFEMGMGAGFGVGTGKQVEPPLDNGELTDKGFLFEGRAMIAYRLTRLMSVGFTVPISFGYYTKVGSGTNANNADNHYSGMSAAGMLTFRAEWVVK